MRSPRKLKVLALLVGSAWSDVMEPVSFCRVGGMLVARDRAFATPQQRLEFLTAARAYLAENGPGVGMRPPVRRRKRLVSFPELAYDSVE
jgi:hypothetical protein